MPPPVNPLPPMDDLTLASTKDYVAEANTVVMDEERRSCLLSSGHESGAGAERSREKEPLSVRYRAVERLIYRNYRYLAEKLEVTIELVDLLESRKLFSDTEILHLRDVLQRHRNRPPPCRPVNKLLVGMVLGFVTNGEVDHFLWCLEQQQKEIPWTILKGETLKEITKGTLSGGSGVGHMASPTASLDSSAGSGTLSLSGSATSASLAAGSANCEAPKASSPVGVDYDEYPEPDVDFEDSEFHVPLSPVPDPMQDEWPPKFNIGPGGGTFHACQDSVFVSVPRGALEEEKQLYVLEATIEETHQVQDSSVYIGKALCFGENGLQFRRFVTVTVEDDKLSSADGDKVYIFGSDTSEDELPDFKDATAVCSPTMDSEKKKITFQVDHFSFYVYVIAAAAIPVAVVSVLLRNREARIEILAEAFPDRRHAEGCQLQINAKPPGYTGSKIDLLPNYHLVSCLHDKFLLAPFDKEVCFTLAYARVGEDSSEQRWELERSAARRLPEGMGCPDFLRPQLVRKSDAGSDGAFFPIVAAFECKTIWTEKTVMVEFEIDPSRLAFSPVPYVPPAPLPPAPPCRADHTAAARAKPMSKERKQALQKLHPELLGVAPTWAISTIVAELVVCGVVRRGYLDERLESLPISHDRMRLLLFHVNAGNHTVFECFHHALDYVVTWSDLPQRLLDEEQQALQQSNTDN